MEIEFNSERWFDLRPEEDEIWKGVVGMEDKYMVSNLGRVMMLPRTYVDKLGRKRVFTKKILKVYYDRRGYAIVNLSGCCQPHSRPTHVLIADAFIPNPDNLQVINHKDENKAHSVLSNLERCTNSYNLNYGNAPKKRAEGLRKAHARKKIWTDTKRQIDNTILQYDLEGNIIYRFEDGYKQITKSFGKYPQIISCCNHIIKSVIGYVWRYENDPFSYDATPYIKPKKERIGTLKKQFTRKVELLDESNNVVRSFSTLYDASKTLGIDRKYLSDKPSVNGIKTIKGYRMRVEDKKFVSVPVSQYDFKGGFIKTYDSARIAAKELGNADAPTITNCCRGFMKSAYGYIWKYANE